MNHKLQKANPQHICTAKKIKLHRRRHLIKSFQNTTNRGKRIILSIYINFLRKNRIMQLTAQLLQAYIHHVQTGLLFSCKTSACSDFCFLLKTIPIPSVFILRFYLSRVTGKYMVQDKCMDHVKTYRKKKLEKKPTEMHAQT